MSFFQRIIKSTYDFKSYQVFAKEPLKKSIIYFITVTILIGLISVIASSIISYSFLSYSFDKVFEQIPNLDFKDGMLSVNKDKPTVINEFGTSIVIDTAKNSDMDIVSDGLIFDVKARRDALTIGNGEKSIVVKYSELKLKNFSIDKSNMNDYVNMAKNITLIVVIIYSILGYLLIIFVNILISIVLIFAARLLITRFKLIIALSNKDIYKICLHSLTTPILLSPILTIFVLFTPQLFLLNLTISVFMVYKVTKLIGKEGL